MNTAGDILTLISRLYPSGRAWKYTRKDSNSESFTDGIDDEYTDSYGNVFTTNSNSLDGKSYIEAKSKAYQRLYEDALAVLAQILPDNDVFNELDASNWERVYQIISESGLSLDERKEAILSKITYPNDIAERQTEEFLQKKLRESGFDVYVHENRFDNSGTFEVINPIPSIFGQAAFGRMFFGNVGLEFSGVVKNYIEESVDGYIGYEASSLNNIFFISGSALNTFADLNEKRKNEFRQLVLQLKPLHSAAVLQINWV